MQPAVCVRGTGCLSTTAAATASADCVSIAPAAYCASSAPIALATAHYARNLSGDNVVLGRARDDSRKGNKMLDESTGAEVGWDYCLRL